MSQIAVWTLSLISLGLASGIGIDPKGCHFNDAIFNQKVFHNNACWKCYENLSEKGRLQKVYCLVEHDALNFTVPGFLIRDRCVPFDYKSSSISELVQSSVSSDVFELWIKCCRDAHECCERMVENYQAENFFNSCDAHWDGYNCLRETLPGGFESMSCPYSMRKGDDSVCDYSYTKSCQHNGTWTKSDFSQCYQNERLRNYSEWHIALLSISLVFCLLPILSPIMSRAFQGKHSKTLVALIAFVAVRNVLKLSTVSMVYDDSSTPTINALACRLIASFTHFCNNMIYVCIALLSLKLLQILKGTTENWGMFILMSIGLIVSIVCTVLWSFMMKIYADKLCWLVDHHNHWINDGCNLLMLLVAGVMLLLCIYHKSEKYDDNVVYFLKILIIPLLTFVAPLSLTVVSSLMSCCNYEDFLNFLAIFLMLLQAISVCVIFFIPSKSNLKLNTYWSVAKISTQNSNASLAPSGLSFGRDDHLHTWLDVMTHAKHSVCYENDVVNDQPEPYRNSLDDVVRRSAESVPRTSSRHTIRQVMLRAKSNLGQIEEITPKKCSTPPLPKVIPNQILDDVQLFDFYYKNLDSICINGDERSAEGAASTPATAAEKRSTFKAMGKMFSMRGAARHGLDDPAVP